MTLRPIAVPCEAARYGATVLYLPDLWADPAVWRGWAGFLGHRGWGGWLLPIRDLDGGVEDRATAVATFAASLPTPPVLIGHGAGAVVAARAAAMVPVTAVVLAAPLLPGESPLGTMLLRWDALWPLLSGGRVGPPSPAQWAPWLAGVGGGVADQIVSGLAPESARLLLDVARGRGAFERTSAPALVVGGTADPVAPAAGVAAVATRLGARHETFPGLGHWLLAGPRWERTVGVVHRWLVRQLDEPMLDFYAEAMADRDDPDDD